MESISKTGFNRLFVASNIDADGLMTSVRVFPDDLYHRVIETDEKISKDEVFEEIVRRYGNFSVYQPTPPDAMQRMMNPN